MHNIFLPTTREEMLSRGWDAPDFVFVTGDAYVDHPSFGCAILSRVLEAEGYRVVILAQPDWKSRSAFMRFGRPKLGFLVSAGVIDSMVNHYTAAKKRRNGDAYAPGGKSGHRPDRATIVYCNRIREAYGNIPIVIGGVEASLRRFAHYDYWDDKVRRSILIDSGADILLYGMGEETIVTVAELLKKGLGTKSAADIQNHLSAAPCSEEYNDTLDPQLQKVDQLRKGGLSRSPQGDFLENIKKINGACFVSSDIPEGYHAIPSFSAVSKDKRAYAEAFIEQYRQQDPIRGRRLAQDHDGRWLCQNPPAMPLSREALDRVYTLPFARNWHFSYESLGGVPALEEVEFSISGTRGCFGGCSFCALSFHQGRIVTSRSPESIVREAELLTKLPNFKGYIHDIGGPTANFRKPACGKQGQRGACADRQCLHPTPCKNLRPDHREFLQILRRVRALPGVKKAFIRSGLRYDYILLDKEGGFLRELLTFHVSGRLKVAPEHVSDRVLSLMGKPKREIYDRFVQKCGVINEKLGKKQYVQPYLMSGHPGSDLPAAVELAEYLRDTGERPEQVQDFYPTPGTLSTCMFYTGLDPRNMKPVYVPSSAHEKAMQRALLQYRKPQNWTLVREALHAAGREDLIGYGKKCLVPPVLANRFMRTRRNSESNQSKKQPKDQIKGITRGQLKKKLKEQIKEKSKDDSKRGEAKKPRRKAIPGRIGTASPRTAVKGKKK